MHIAYLTFTIMAALANGYAASLNFRSEREDHPDRRPPRPRTPRKARVAHPATGRRAHVISARPAHVAQGAAVRFSAPWVSYLYAHRLPHIHDHGGARERLRRLLELPI